MARENRIGKVMIILIVIILVLLSVILYSFVLKPSINGYVVNKQIDSYNQGVNDALNTLLLQLQQQGYAQISNAEGNSINLILPESCNQIQQVQADAQAQ